LQLVDVQYELFVVVFGGGLQQPDRSVQSLQGSQLAIRGSRAISMSLPI